MVTVTDTQTLNGETFVITYEIGAATSATYQAAEIGVHTAKLDGLQFEYDIEEFYIVPGTLKLKIADARGTLTRLIIENAAGGTSVTVTAGGRLLFSGGIIIENVVYDRYGAELTAEFSANTDILNGTLLYNPDGSARDPLGYGTNKYIFLPVTQVITDIFRKIDSEINVTFRMPGTYKGRHKTYFNSTGGVVSEWYADGITFQDLRVMVYPLFFDKNSGMKNLGDVLKKLAFDFGAFAGVKNNSEAFFISLLTVEYNSIRDINAGAVINVNEQYGALPVKSVTITEGVLSNNYPFFMQLVPPEGIRNDSGTRYYWNQFHANNIRYGSATEPPAFKSGDYTGIESENVEKQMFAVFYYRKLVRDGLNPGIGTAFYWQGVYMFPGATGKLYFINYAETGGGSYEPLGQNLARVWLTALGNVTNVNALQLRVIGTGYEITDIVAYNGVYYLPLRVTRRYMERETELLLIKINPDIVPAPEPDAPARPVPIENVVMTENYII